MNPAPILQLITARQAAVGLAADQLREQISTLAQQLSVLETELADLATTHSTLLRLAGHPEQDTAGAGPDTAPTHPTYQHILAAFTTAEQPLRAKDICSALGMQATANHTESLRAKLKRLVARGILTEDQPGLFALAPPTADPADAPLA